MVTMEDRGKPVTFLVSQALGLTSLTKQVAQTGRLVSIMPEHNTCVVESVVLKPEPYRRHVFIHNSKVFLRHNARPVRPALLSREPAPSLGPVG